MELCRAPDLLDRAVDVALGERRLAERMRELEMKAAAAISPEEAVLFVKVIKQYAKTFQEGVQQ